MWQRTVTVALALALLTVLPFSLSAQNGLLSDWFIRDFGQDDSPHQISPGPSGSSIYILIDTDNWKIERLDKEGDTIFRPPPIEGPATNGIRVETIDTGPEYLSSGFSGTFGGSQIGEDGAVTKNLIVRGFAPDGTVSDLFSHTLAKHSEAMDIGLTRTISKTIYAASAGGTTEGELAADHCAYIMESDEVVGCETRSQTIPGLVDVTGFNLLPPCNGEGGTAQVFFSGPVQNDAGSADFAFGGFFGPLPPWYEVHDFGGFDHPYDVWSWCEGGAPNLLVTGYGVNQADGWRLHIIHLDGQGNPVARFFDDGIHAIPLDFVGPGETIQSTVSAIEGSGHRPNTVAIGVNHVTASNVVSPSIQILDLDTLEVFEPPLPGELGDRSITLNSMIFQGGDLLAAGSIATSSSQDTTDSIMFRYEAVVSQDDQLYLPVISRQVRPR